MITRWLTYFSFACFGLLSLVVLQMTKRPLCIESKVVERIDRLGLQKSESIYRCAINKETPYSEYFGQKNRELSARVQSVERVLESIEPFYQKVQVTILQDRPYLYRIQGHQLFIGEKLLEAPGHLEKALAKIWYRERNEISFPQQSLFEEVVTDFLVYLQYGDLDIGDPNTLLVTAIHKVKWPYILKSIDAYCESAWKQSEHFATCYSSLKTDADLMSFVTEMSLRPLLVSSWIHSYRQLGMKERFEFVANLPQLIRSEHAPQLPVFAPMAMGAQGSTLAKAAEAIKSVNLFVSSSILSKESNAHKSFVANMTNELRASGFQEAFAEANFDVLFVSQEPIKESSQVFQDFIRVMKSHPKMQIALRDQKNLWMLPSRFPVPLASFGQIKANRTIVEKCGGYNFSYVMDYAELTEKLLVVDHCDLHKRIMYEQYLAEGAEGFGAQNKGTAFVQFHLPSLLMKKDELQQVTNVFDFIKNRDVESSSFKSLGWKEVRWNQQANAYQPKAFVDAIEWFRIPNQDSL